MDPAEGSGQVEEGACGKCGRLCEPAELEVCPICGRKFCLYCLYRVGSRNYCGRPCGDAFFFGGEFDEESSLEED